MSSFDVPTLIHVISDPDLGQDCANRMQPSLDSPLFCFIFINLVNCSIYMMFKATHLTLNLRNINALIIHAGVLLFVLLIDQNE